LTVTIEEEWKTKTKRRNFFYFYDGNKLRHISKIPEIKKIIEIKNENKHIIKYEVPENLVNNLIVFSTSNKTGNLGYNKCNLNEKNEIICNINVNIKPEMFEIDNNELRNEIEYMREMTSEMINDIKDFIKNYSLNDNFWIFMTKTRDYISNFDEGLISTLMFPDDNQKKKSIEQVMKFIHQIWISLLIAKLLNTKQIYCSVFEQGTRKSDPPSFIFKNESNLYYLWHEYQYIGETPSYLKNERSEFFDNGIFMWRRRDIMVIKSKTGETDFLKIKGNDFAKADLVIECKHLPIEKWLLNQEMFDNLLKSLRAYKEFPPNTNNILLISIFEIPFDYKNRLEQEGITIIDGFHPNNLNKIKEFENYLIKTLS